MNSLRRALWLSTLLPALFVACGSEDTGTVQQAAVISPDLVISQVYGGGGNSGATYKNDFVEVFNLGSSAVQLQGYSIQYASTAGLFQSGTNTYDLPIFSLQPGQYFLIQLASGGSIGATLPTVDTDGGSINLSGTDGKVALVFTNNKLSNCGSSGSPCSATDWVDLVGYGSASQSETAAVGTLSNVKSALRAGGGCTDTGSNLADFTTPVPSARNSLSALNVCGADAGSDAGGDAALDGAALDGAVFVDAGSDADLDADVDGALDADTDAPVVDAGVDADLDAGVDADLDAGVDADLDGSTDGAADGSSDAGPPVLAISQVYGGGGNSGAPYVNDFVELLNRGSVPAQLQGYSVQYASATGNFVAASNTLDLPAFALQPGQYFLVQLAGGGDAGVALPTPDAIGAANLSGTAGKVALVASSQKLDSCGTTMTPCATTWLDFVGYGTTAQQYEGSGPAPAPSNTKAVLRAQNGCVDTNDNAADFAAGAPTPRNSSNTAVCGGGDAGADGGTITDAGADASKADASTDASTDAAPPKDAAADATPPKDAATADARADSGGTDSGTGAGTGDDSGCSCSQAGESKPPWSSGVLTLAVGLVLLRRRRTPTA